MKWKLLVGLLIASLVEIHAAQPADACGVKLTVKSSTPRKAVARTSNPSDVLLLGNPPRRLELDLSAAGHRVEVAPTASSAKRKSYAVVIADSGLQDEARSNFNGAVVVVRSGDVASDMRSVEAQVARRPVRTSEARTVVAARSPRTPVAAGPAQPERRIVAASEPKDPQAVPDTAPQPDRVAAAVPKATEPKPVETKVTPPKATEPKVTEPKVTEPRVTEPRVTVPKATEPRTTEPRATDTAPKQPRTLAVKPNTVHDEVYFALGGATLDKSATGPLTRAVRWLNGASDAHVVIEGHADPTGTPEGNMALAQKRAEWVRDYLVSAGIDESRLEVISYGDTRLRYGRTDRRNRRAAIVAK
ncbi:MAG TPA: OmpA family protein [Kofleriaceae bacterium]|nr:OmpA family protein [Kofleriaceae bacterium]